MCSRSFGPEPRRDGTLITRLSTTLNSRPMLRCVAGGEADEAEPCGSRIPLRQNPAVMNRGAYMERLPPRCTDVRIWHLQGMKLNHANCYLRAIARIPKAGATERVHSGSGAPLARGGMTGSGKGGTAPHGRENGMASGPASGGVSDQGVDDASVCKQAATRRCTRDMSLERQCDPCTLVKFAALTDRYEGLRAQLATSERREHQSAPTTAAAKEDVGGQPGGHSWRIPEPSSYRDATSPRLRHQGQAVRNSHVWRSPAMSATMTTWLTSGRAELCGAANEDDALLDPRWW